MRLYIYAIKTKKVRNHTHTHTHRGSSGKGNKYFVYIFYGLMAASVLAGICGLESSKSQQVLPRKGGGGHRGCKCRQIACEARSTDRDKEREREHHKNYFKSDAERFSGVDTDMT